VLPAQLVEVLSNSYPAVAPAVPVWWTLPDADAVLVAVVRPLAGSVLAVSVAVVVLAAVSE
jgi:hypothetical protein